MKITRRLKLQKVLRKWHQRLPLLRRIPLPMLLAAVFILLTTTGGIATRGIISNNNSINLTQGLQAHWEFNGDANDSSGNGYHGTVFGATLTQDKFNNPDNAYDFDGVNDYIATTKALTEPNELSQMTVTAWIKVNPGEGHWAILDFDRSEYFNSTISGTSTVTDKVGFHTNAAGSSINDMSGNAIVADGTWHHVTWLYDGTDKVIYVDGVEDARVANPHGGLALGSGLDRYGMIGDGSEATSFNGTRNNVYFDGTADSIRFYDRALNEAEIAALYNTQEYPGEIQSSDLQKGLVGHWKMDGDGKDATPSSNHGTVSGVTPSPDRHSIDNSSYQYDGNDIITVPDKTELNFDANDSFSVSLWYKFPDGTQNPYWSLGKGQAYSETGYGIAHWTEGNPIAPSFYIRDGTNRVNVNAGSLTRGQWGLITFVVDRTSQTMRSYTNGALSNSTNISTVASVVNTEPLLLGGMDGARYHGLLDDIRIYNRALGASDIQQLYDSYSPVVSVSSLSKGLVGHWNFNGDAKDKTPNSNHGVQTGTVTAVADRMNRPDSAYNFSGYPSSFAVGSDSELNIQNDITLSAWINPVDDGTSRSIITWINGEISGYPFHFLLLPSNVLRINASNMTVLNGNAAITPGTWSHIAVTISGTEVTFYINGQVDAVRTASTATRTAGTGHVTISREDASQVFNGAMDDVRVYNRALAAPEILRLYETY